MALELVTYADMKKLLELQDAAITDYPPLEVINDTMINSFEVATGRKLNNESRTEVVFINNFYTARLMLRAIPITAMTSVTVTMYGVSESWTENSDYEVTEYGLRLWARLKNAKVTVVYTGGLSAVTEEPNMNRAALYQLAYEFQSKDQIGAESVSNEGGSVQRPALTLLPETKRLLVPSLHPLHTPGKV